MVIKTNNILERPDKKPIIYDTYYTKNSNIKPLVIFCHGYKGFKDWGAWGLIANAFAKAGCFFLKFNFSHNGGTVTQPIDFPDLEAFAQNNYTKELDDLEAIINHVITNTAYKNEIDPSKISLIGHSRGAGIVLIKAAENKTISQVVTWAGVSDYKSRFKEESDTFKQWKASGRFYVENGRTKQQMPHDWQFYQDFIINETRLTIKKAVTSLNKPLLIIHGDQDPTVSINEAKTLHSWNAASTLKVIKGANHVFGASHPWIEKKMPYHLQQVFDITTSFLDKKGENTLVSL